MLELMVVVGLIAATSFVLLVGFGEGRSTALQAGQSTLANLATSARARSFAKGRPVRLLIHHEAASPQAAERYLRFVVMEEMRENEWRVVQTATLPAGIHVLPHQSRMPATLLVSPTTWTRVDGSRLHSSALFRPLVSRQIDGPVAELWAELVFSAHGTTAASGQVVVTPGRMRPPGGEAAGTLAFAHPEQVRGLQLSAYGLTTPISSREGF